MPGLHRRPNHFRIRHLGFMGCKPLKNHTIIKAAVKMAVKMGAALDGAQ